MCQQCVKLVKKTLPNDIIIHRSTLVSTLDTIKCPAMKALEDLTPSGSEFVEDPEFCFRHVRGKVHNLQDLLISKVKRIKELEAQSVGH